MPGEFSLTGNSMKLSFKANNIENLSFAAAVIRVHIFNVNTGVFEVVTEESKPFYKNNIADFYIQEVFADEKLFYSIADLNGGVFDYVRYKVSFHLEWFDNNNQHQSTEWITSSEWIALPGGVSREYEANFTKNGNSIEDLFESLAWRWLSNHPPIKRIRKGQFDFLNFLTHTHASNLKLIRKIGNNETTLATFNNSQDNKIVMWKMNFDWYFENNVESFTVYLRWNNTTIAERTYYLEQKNVPVTSVFYFRNSFGTLESLVCNGNLIAEREINTDNIYQAGRTEKPTLTSPDILSDRKIYDTKYAADIGYHNDKRFQDFIIELMISEDVWRTENDYIFPVVVSVKKYSFIDEKNNNVLRAEIEWKRSFTEKYLTNDNILHELLGLSINGQTVAITFAVGTITPINLTISSSSNWQLQKIGNEPFYGFSQITGNAGTTTIQLFGHGNDVTGTAKFKLTNDEGLTVNGTVNKLGKILVDNTNPTTINRSGIKESFKINIHSDRNFTILKTEGENWITLSSMSGGINGVNITASVDLNIDVPRTAKYTVKSDFATCELTVKQNSKIVYNLIDNKGNNLIVF